MAQALEKLFLTKVAQMPQEEVELPPPSKPGDAGAKRGKKGKRVAPPSELTSHLFGKVHVYTLYLWCGYRY